MKINQQLLRWNAIRFVPMRGYAAAAKAERMPAFDGELKKAKFPNGLSVVALENNSPISRIGIFVKAGPRYENSNNLGITHSLRNIAGMSTKTFSIFGITRNMDYQGAQFTVSSTRDALIYKVETNRDTSAYNFGFVVDTFSRPAFKPWEISDFHFRMKMDLARLKQDPQARMMEDLHKCAFKGGLSNSMYSKEFMIPQHDHNALMHYVHDNYKSRGVSVVGVGVDHDRLLDFVEASFTFNDGDVNTSDSKFIGGEIRRIRDSDICHAAVVSEVAGGNNLKEVVIVALLQSLLGNGIRMKYGTGACKLSEGVGKVAKNPFAVSSLNISHSDCGLFGFTIAGSHDEMHTIIKAAVSKLRETAKNFSENDLQAAKKSLKTSLHMHYENNDNILEELGAHEMNLGKIFDLREVDGLIDQISLADVKPVMTKISKSKGAMASTGKMDNMPHLCDLA